MLTVLADLSLLAENHSNDDDDDEKAASEMQEEKKRNRGKEKVTFSFPYTAV